MNRIRPIFLLNCIAALLSACATGAPDRFKWPSSPLTVDEAKPLIESGLCETRAEYLEQSACEEWKIFLNAGEPQLAPQTFAVGPAFRVELSKSYQIAWSEKNPIYVLYNSGASDDLKSVGLIQVESDNAGEEREVERYLLSAFKGTRNRESPFHAYIAGDVLKPHPHFVFAHVWKNGAVAKLGEKDVAYLRQQGKKLYLFISSIHSNAYEYDQHPVLYFAVLAAPD